MRRSAAIAAAVAAAAAIAAVAPAVAATRESRAWERLLRARDVEGRSAQVFVRPGGVSGRRVDFVVGVHESAPGPVTFPDGLYGATAWAYRDGRWRRLDTAKFRTLVAPVLEPGQRVNLGLPLKRHVRRVRVMVPAPGRRAAWADVH